MRYFGDAAEYGDLFTFVRANAASLDEMDRGIASSIDTSGSVRNSKNERMDGWTDWWMDGWRDWWMDGWMDGPTDGWMDGWMDG